MEPEATRVEASPERVREVLEENESGRKSAVRHLELLHQELGGENGRVQDVRSHVRLQRETDDENETAPSSVSPGLRDRHRRQEGTIAKGYVHE